MAAIASRRAESPFPGPRGRGGRNINRQMRADARHCHSRADARHYHGSAAAAGGQGIIQGTVMPELPFQAAHPPAIRMGRDRPPSMAGTGRPPEDGPRESGLAEGPARPDRPRRGIRPGGIGDPSDRYRNETRRTWRRNAARRKARPDRNGGPANEAREARSRPPKPGQFPALSTSVRPRWPNSPRIRGPPYPIVLDWELL